METRGLGWIHHLPQVLLFLWKKKKDSVLLQSFPFFHLTGRPYLQLKEHSYRRKKGRNGFCFPGAEREREKSPFDQSFLPRLVLEERHGTGGGEKCRVEERATRFKRVGTERGRRGGCNFTGELPIIKSHKQLKRRKMCFATQTVEGPAS